MIYVILLGFVMIGINLMFSYLELRPFLDALKTETNRSDSLILRITMIPRILRHLPKLIPTICDLGGMWLLTSLFSLGTGFAGGLAGLFGSNVLSLIIYYHTHMKHKHIHVRS